MILKFKSAGRNPLYFQDMIDQTGGRIYEENGSFYADVADGLAWRFCRASWKPQNCIHADYGSKTIACQVHYSNMHTVWGTYPDLIFQPSGLPDFYEDRTYYTIRHKACGNCEDQLGPHILTGPSEGMFSL